MVDIFLPHHVHFCFRGDAVVFLDLQRDDYTLVGTDGAAALRCLSSLESTSAIGGARPEQRAALDEMLGGGLLTTDPNAGRAIAPTSLTRATQPLLDDDAALNARISAGHLLNFLVAGTIAAARLHWGQLHRTIAHVQRRKRKRASSTSIDVERARELVAIFRRLRSLFPRRYLCLYDSLALIEFLARYGVHPNWIFGVRLEPWAAHCWVEGAGYIFNEELEEAAGYTPVMVV